MPEFILTLHDTEETRVVTLPDTRERALKCCCPWHDEEKPSCVLSLKHERFYCFTCRAYGDCTSETSEEEYLLDAYEQFVIHAEMQERGTPTRNQEWWNAYNRYLQTPAWEERRQRVMERAKYTCEGCGIERASQVHHLTYARVGHEMLFDLVALCRACHRRIHDGKKGFSS